MIKNSTKLKVIDNSGGKIARCIDVVGKKKIAYVGNLLVITLHKCIHKKKVKKRCIYFGLIVNIKYWTKRLDGLFIKFFSNRLLVFNNKYKFLGTRIYGVVAKEIKLKSSSSKRTFKSFQKVISYSTLIV